MSLKEYTKDLHTEIEKTQFAKLLLSGNITPAHYTNYLYQLLLVYYPIEFGAKMVGALDNLPGLERSALILADFGELSDTQYNGKWCPATIKYHNYLIDLINDVDRRPLIKAHLYVRHMGDLFGGQYIAKKVPGSGKMYQFTDMDLLKTNIRSLATDELGDEARIAFKWSIDIMNELYE